MGLVHAGLGLLFSVGLLFNAWDSQVAEHPSAQHWPHLLCPPAAVLGIAWEKLRSMLRLDKLNAAVCP